MLSSEGFFFFALFSLKKRSALFLAVLCFCFGRYLSSALVAGNTTVGPESGLNLVSSVLLFVLGEIVVPDVNKVVAVVVVVVGCLCVVCVRVFIIFLHFA